MTETEFLERADGVLRRLENAFDAAVGDIEVTRAGNVLTLELSDGAKIVINSQAPMQQMWVAARSGAHHYSWDGIVWRDTRDGSELFASLSRILSALGGTPIVLTSGSTR
jgi:CyaY protein